MPAPVPDRPGVADPGQGRRLGIDVGTVRIGVALSDRDALLAQPLETIARETGFSGRDLGDIDRLMQIIEERDVVEVIIGLPRHLSGRTSVSVKHAREFAFRIRRRLDRAGSEVPVRLADERLSTVIANQTLQQANISQREGRQVVDQIAAVVILQSWLDGRKHYFEHQEHQEHQE